MFLVFFPYISKTILAQTIDFKTKSYILYKINTFWSQLKTVDDFSSCEYKKKNHLGSSTFWQPPGALLCTCSLFIPNMTFFFCCYLMISLGLGPLYLPLCYIGQMEP